MEKNEIFAYNTPRGAIHIIDGTAQTRLSMLLSPSLQLGCQKPTVHIKMLHEVSFQGLCLLNNAFVQVMWKPASIMLHVIPCIPWWDGCKVFVDLSPILHFHSGNAQHVRMQRTSCEVLQQPTCKEGLWNAIYSSKSMPGHTTYHTGIIWCMPKKSQCRPFGRP